MKSVYVLVYANIILELYYIIVCIVYHSVLHPYSPLPVPVPTVSPLYSLPLCTPFHSAGDDPQ